MKTLKQKANIRKWIAALLSGKYKQGDLLLYSPYDKTYCCLGVACRVLKMSTKQILAQKTVEQDQGNTLLSKSTAKKFGLSLDAQDSLADMNDRGDTFKQIAAYIKKTFLK